jgi:capsular exopolysaccharide synthesis family protein
MSRIQDILSKAERDGTVRRTRSLTDDISAPRSLTPRRMTPPPGEEPAGSGPAPISTPVASWSASSAAVAPALTVDAPAARSFELDRHLVAALAPTCLAAEQYRSLRARIKRAEGNRSIRAMVITSPAKGDGKSLTAANLALTMGQEFQQRILLVDADLRRPTVHRLFGLGDGPGLSDVLMGGAELNDVLVTLPEYHITILPAGTPPSHPAEMLGSASMRRTLDTLRTQFDRILIDMPPVAPLADLQIVAPQVDGVLLIIRAGVTPKPAIEQALAGLDMSKVLGLVLNESGGTISSRQAYEGYGYIAG